MYYYEAYNNLRLSILSVKYKRKKKDLLVLSTKISRMKTMFSMATQSLGVLR